MHRVSLRLLLAIVLGLIFAFAAHTNADASTGYRSATCYVSDGIHSGYTSFHVTTWRNADGSRTWHWAGYDRYVSYPAPPVSLRFRGAMEYLQDTYAAGHEGYYTYGADVYATWRGYWWRYIGDDRWSWSCSLRV